MHSTVTSVQFVFAASAVYLSRSCGILEVDELELAKVSDQGLQVFCEVDSTVSHSFCTQKVKPFAIYTAAFVLGIYCNMRALGASNVETVIGKGQCKTHLRELKCCDSIPDMHTIVRFFAGLGIPW